MKYNWYPIVHKRKYRKNFLVTYFYDEEKGKSQGYGQEPIVVTALSIKSCLVDVSQAGASIMKNKGYKNVVILNVTEALR